MEERPRSVGEALESGVAEEVRLSREMGLLDATMLGIGALMGGGIFVLIGLASDVAGPAVMLAFALNVFVTIPTLLVYAELGSAFHDAGGGYLWIREALGQSWGFLGGWISWFSHAVACAVYALASGKYFEFFFRLADIQHAALTWHIGTGFLSLDVVKLFAIVFAGLFTWLNVRGIKHSARAENAITSIVLIIILVFIGAGLWQVWLNPGRVGPAFADTFPRGAGGLFLAMGLTFIAFEGYEIIAQSSEEVKDPKRNVPRAVFLSMIVMAPIYVLICFVALTAIVPPDGMPSWLFLAGGGELALVHAAADFLPFGAALLLGAALLSNITALNATIYSSSRVSFAMGRAGTLPSWLGRISERRQTPAPSIVASGVIIVGMAVLLPIEGVVAAADIMFLLLFLLVNISFIKLRSTTRHLDYGYRLPGFPLTPLLGIAGCIFLAVTLWWIHPVASLGDLLLHPWVAAIAWLGVGAGVYAVYVRPKQVVVPSPTLHATAHEEAAREAPRPLRLLLPVSNPRQVERLATAAGNVAKELDAEVHLLYVVSVPRMLPLAEGKQFVDRAFPVLNQGRQILAAKGVPTHTLVRIGHDIPRVIRATAEEKGADLIILGWRGEPTVKDFALGSTLDPLVADPPCDVAVLKVGKNVASDVLVPTQGGRHAALCIRLGSAIAKRRGVPFTLFSIVPPGGDRVETEAMLTSLLADHALPGTDARIRVAEGREIVAAIAREAKAETLVVLGATEQPFWKTQLFGDKPEAVARRVPHVLMVKSRSGRTATVYRRMADRMKKWGDYLVPEVKR